MQIYGPNVVGGLNISRFDDIPPWSTEYIATIIYVISTDTYYFGMQHEWIELPNANHIPGLHRMLGGSGGPGGTGNTGARGPYGPHGRTGGSGETGETGDTGGTGGSGGTGASGGSGGTGHSGGTGGIGGTGPVGECIAGETGATGGSGSHGLIGTMLGDGDSATLLCMVDVILRGQSGDGISVEFKNIYNSFDIPVTIVSKGLMENNLILSDDGLTISIYPDFFATHNIKSAIANLTFNNSLKEVQVYVNHYFDIRLFHPLDGKYQDITGWLDQGHTVRFQVMYVAARKLSDILPHKEYVDFHAVALDSSFDFPYVWNTVGFGGAGQTFDVEFVLDIPPGFTYDSVEVDFGSDDVTILSSVSCKYLKVGSYDVTMTLFGGVCGETRIKKTAYINVNSSLDPQFSHTFLSDQPDQYPKRVQFHPEVEFGAQHLWYFDEVHNPTFFSEDVSPIITYEEENTSYRVTHEIKIDGRIRTETGTVLTKFNPTLDFTLEWGEFDPWNRVLPLMLKDATVPDEVLLTWTWYIYEYIGQEFKYLNLGGKELTVDYELGFDTNYNVGVDFDAYARDADTWDGPLHMIQFIIPFIERGLIAGGQTGYSGMFNIDSIWVLNPLNVANTTLWGNLTRACQSNCGGSNGSTSEGIIVEGYNRNSDGINEIYYDIAEKYKISTFAKTSIDFARLSDKSRDQAACSNSTNDKLVIVGGKNESAVNLNTIHIISISTGTDLSLFGQLSQGLVSLSMSSNGTGNRGFFIGGFNDIAVQDIEYFSFANSGVIDSFAELSSNMINACAVSNTTNNRILLAGGQNESPSSPPINNIQTFNAYAASSTTYFGNLYATKTNVGGFSTGIGNHAIFTGGQVEIILDDYYNPGYWNQWSTEVEIVNIVSGANTELFGSLVDINSHGTAGSAGMSNSI